MSRRRDAEAFLRHLWAMEGALVAAGMPAMPPWWRETLERFYRSGKRRLIVRKGRRVYASTCVAPRLAVAEMLFGEHRHVAGTPPLVFAFLSVKRDEAAKRLHGVRAILDVLHEPYNERGETIELTNRPATFAVITANHRTNVGDTVAFAWCDEVASWNDDELGANPAEQVIGRLAPAQATLPDAKLFLVSSPLGTEDYHARQFDLGETSGQCVAFGETWTINPTLTREMCQELEPDPKLLAREYGAIPSATASPAFDPDLVNTCFRDMPRGGQWWPAVGMLDSAAGKSLKSDQMTWGSVCYVLPPEPSPYLRGPVPRLASVRINGVEKYVPNGETVVDILRDQHGNPLPNPEALKPRVPALAMTGIDSVSGVFSGALLDGSLWKKIASFFRYARVGTVWGDPYCSIDAKRMLGGTGIQYRELTWSNESKKRAVYRLRQLMADRALILPRHAERLRGELLAYQERISPSGAISYSARGAGKDDHVALLVNATMAELEYGLPGSPQGLSFRHEASGR